MKKFLTSVAAVGLIGMGGAAFAQGIVLVPQAEGSDGRSFMLVPVPEAAAGASAGAEAGAEGASRRVEAMALDFYQRGYQRGVADAARSGVQVDPAAFEQIGRELFERGYMLGLMQAHAEMTAAEMPEFEGQASATSGSGQQTVASDTDAADATGQATQQQLAKAESPAAEGVAAEGPQVVLGSRDTDRYGAFIVDDTGRPVYMFEPDKRGTGEAVAESTCSDACAEAWPPVTSAIKPLAEDMANETLISGFERADGTYQVTYNGWPLYYYMKDEGAEMPTGQDIEGFGGEWYLLKPDGEMVGHE